ncbi:MAG TPA: mitofilin family membrane protein [Azospirillaceae bacterium]|nr:mitofilin family membrane protein [Azospirillaceae bacterium]
MTSTPGSDPPDHDNDGTSPANGAPGDAQTARAVDHLIGKFGGIRPMAHKLSVPVTTVQGWKKRGAIPTNRHGDLRAAAGRLKISLTAAELEATAPAEERPRSGTGGARLASVYTTPTATTPPLEAAKQPTPPEKAGETMPEKKTPGTPGDTPPATPSTPSTPPTPSASGAKPESTQPAKPEAAKVEPAKVEPAKVEPAKSGAAKPEAAKAEPVKATVTTPPPAAAAAPARRGGSGAAWLAALVSVLGAGAAVTAPAWAPQYVYPLIGVTSPDQRIADIERRLSGRIQTLEQAVAGLRNQPAPAPVDLGPLTSRLEALEQRPAQAPAQPAADTGALANRLQGLENTVEGLSQRIAAVATGKSEADIGPLVDQLQGMSRRLAALEQRNGQGGLDTAALNQALAPLATRLAQIEGTANAAAQNAQAVGVLDDQVKALSQEVSAASAKANEVAGTLAQKTEAETAAQALVIAAANLRQALATSAPFQNELNAVNSLGAKDPEVAQALEKVAPFAASGIPSEARLIERFEVVAPQVVQAARQDPNANWAEEALTRLQGLVSVRRQGGNVAGEDADATVARAEAKLKQGDLAGAVAELSGLSGPPADAAQPWLKDAQARLSARDASDTLAREAVALLSNAAGGAQP